MSKWKKETSLSLSCCRSSPVYSSLFLCLPPSIPPLVHLSLSSHPLSMQSLFFLVPFLPLRGVPCALSCIFLTLSYSWVPLLCLMGELYTSLQTPPLPFTRKSPAPFPTGPRGCLVPVLQPGTPAAAHGRVPADAPPVLAAAVEPTLRGPRVLRHSPREVPGGGGNRTTVAFRGSSLIFQGSPCDVVAFK